MKKILVFLLVAVMLATSVQAAAYIKIDDIKGESTDKDHTIVIKPQLQKTPCEYHQNRSGKHYCLCPVRNDIYKRYKI